MIFEGALDELVKDVWSNKTMDVGTREVICKRLFLRCEFRLNFIKKRHTTMSPTRPYSSQRTPNSSSLTNSSV